MDSEVLNQILNGSNEETKVETKANEAEVDTSSNERSEGENGESSETTKKSSSSSSREYEDLQWDEDESEENKEVEIEEKAPDQRSESQDDEELAKIEERNRWMKGRLAPVKEKLTKAEQELAALRAENEALKAGRTQGTPDTKNAAVESQNQQTVDDYINSHPAVKDLTEKLKVLDEKADDLTEKEYIDQKMDILSDLKLAKRELHNQIRYAQESQIRQVQEAESKIEKDYDSAVLSKKEDFPDIDKALNRVKKNASNLDVNIRGMLVFEGDKINPFAAELVNIIGNDKDAMGYLIAQSKLAKKTGRVPVQAIEYLGRLKTRIQSERESEGDMKAPDIDSQISRAKPKPGLPKEVKGKSSGEIVDYQDWARDALRKGVRPW